jgi:hypothetical protein
MEKTIGNEIGRILADAGYRGTTHPTTTKFRIFTAGQKRRVTPAIKCQMRRRSAIEPVIGHIKAEHRMERNYLAGEQGDAVNAILAAAGQNFSLLINWFRQLLWLLIATLNCMAKLSQPDPPSLFTDDLVGACALPRSVRQIDRSGSQIGIAFAKQYAMQTDRLRVIKTGSSRLRSPHIFRGTRRSRLPL